MLQNRTADPAHPPHITLPTLTAGGNGYRRWMDGYYRVAELYHNTGIMELNVRKEKRYNTSEE